MKTFLERLENDERPVILDGATGTELNRRGVDTHLPLWSSWALIKAPEVLYQIHLDYLKAGAEVVTANTFRVHRRSLALAGFGDQAAEYASLAVKIAKDAISTFMVEGGSRAWVAGSIAPLEDCYAPELVPPQEDCLIEHAEIVHNLTQAGADILLIETMNTIREAEAAALAAQETGLPFIVSFVLRTDGRLFSGEKLDQAVERLSRYQPVMLGINCTPSTMISQSLFLLKSLTNLPICGYGNIGKTDDVQGWAFTEDLDPDGYGTLAAGWAAQGIRMIGGCCGTSPEHIAKITQALSS